MVGTPRQKVKPSLGFQVGPDTKLGRSWISAAMKVHNELICNPQAQTDCHQSAFSKQYRQWLTQEERWKPSWDERVKRKNTDKVLKGIVTKIKNAERTRTTDCYPSQRCAEFRKWRARNPSYLPAWNEAKWIKQQMERHDDVIKKAKSSIVTKLHRA